MFHSRITEPKIVGHLSDSVSIEDETGEVWCHCLNLDLRESSSRILRSKSSAGKDWKFNRIMKRKILYCAIRSPRSIVVELYVLLQASEYVRRAFSQLVSDSSLLQSEVEHIEDIGR